MKETSRLVNFTKHPVAFPKNFRYQPIVAYVYNVNVLDISDVALFTASYGW